MRWAVRLRQGNRDLGKYAGNPVIPNNGFGSTFYDGSIYHNFVSYGTINHYTSPDGITWTADTAHNPVLTPTQAWEGSNVGVPMAWKEGDTWYMLYRAGSPNVIGLATSTDAVNWTHQRKPCPRGRPGEWDSVALDPWVLSRWVTLITCGTTPSDCTRPGWALQRSCHLHQSHRMDQGPQ